MVSQIDHGLREASWKDPWGAGWTRAKLAPHRDQGVSTCIIIMAAPRRRKAALPVLCRGTSGPGEKAHDIEKDRRRLWVFGGGCDEYDRLFQRVAFWASRGAVDTGSGQAWSMQALGIPP